MQRDLLIQQIDEAELRTIIREELTQILQTQAQTQGKHEVQSPNRTDLLTLAEVRKLLRISNATLHRRMREHTIQTIKIGRRRLVSVNEIERVLGLGEMNQVRSHRRKAT